MEFDRRQLLVAIGVLAAGCGSQGGPGGTGTETSTSGVAETTTRTSARTATRQPTQTQTQSQTATETNTATEDSTATETETETATETETETETATETETETATETTQNSVAEAAVQNYEQGTHNTQYNSYAGVRGTIKNTGNAHLYVTVMGKFYDADGNLLDSGIASVSALAPGEVWEVWVQYLEDAGDVDSVDLAVDDTFNVESGIDPSKISLDSSSLQVPSDEGASPQITGKATNNRGTGSYLEATGKVYAGNGNVLASGVDTVSEVGAGETWQFNITAYLERSDWTDRVDDHDVVLST